VERIAELVGRVQPLDREAMAASRTHLDSLAKPPGSLGRLEELAVRLAGITGQRSPAVRLAGITGQRSPRLPRKAALVFAADHGVVAEGVSAYEPRTTGRMVRAFVANNAAISVLARLAGARLVVVDVGVAADLTDLEGRRVAPADGAVHTPGMRATPPPRDTREGDAAQVTRGSGASPPRFAGRKVAWGTANLALGPAMTRAECLQAVRVGMAVFEEEFAQGLDLVALGEMGIGNTTPSSALVAALTGAAPALVTGRGSGIDDAALARKRTVVERALAQHASAAGEALDLLARMGGLEIAALVGAILAAATYRVPVVLDGFISSAAALVAVALCPAAREYLLASHRSAEIGHAVALRHLGLDPLLDLDMRLGEGTGAVLAMPLADAALAILGDMATARQAGIADESA
jgi:nicotinate-nucleotide--dimethylbenzimidazole phosphoribosyltransferase